MSRHHPRMHIILMIQSGMEDNTKTYSEFINTDDCMDTVCRIYEEHLRKLYPNKKSITYDLADLFYFIDNLPDLSCLEFKRQTKTYIPHNKEWIKEKIHILLKYKTEHARK